MKCSHASATRSSLDSDSAGPWKGPLRIVVHAPAIAPVHAPAIAPVHACVSGVCLYSPEVCSRTSRVVDRRKRQMLPVTALVELAERERVANSGEREAVEHLAVAHQ